MILPYQKYPLLNIPLPNQEIYSSTQTHGQNPTEWTSTPTSHSDYYRPSNLLQTPQTTNDSYTGWKARDSKDS